MTTYTERFVAKCEKGEFTKAELETLVSSLTYNIERCVNLQKNRVKLEACNKALSTGTYKNISVSKVKSGVNKDTSDMESLDIEEDSGVSQDFEFVVARKYLQLKSSAKKRDKDFNLSLLDVRRLMQRKTCFYTKKRFIDNDMNWKRTVDRIDANKGYVKGNVVACSKWANSLKNVLVEQEDSTLKGCQKELRKFLMTLKDLKI